MEADKRKNKHDHDDQTDEVNYAIHEKSPGAEATHAIPLLTRTAVSAFLLNSGGG